MADLFISYSREDSQRAGQVAQGMIAAGFDVFWDTDVPPGQTWADYIEEKLAKCAAVIVLWSQHSTKSQWVREEARMGRERGKLIPASLDSSMPPFGFGEVQAANLSTWNGEMQGHSDWDRLVGAVHNAVARAKGGEVSPPRAPSPPVPPHASTPPAQPAPAPVQPRPAMAAPPSYAPAPAAGGINRNVIIGGVVAVAVGIGVYLYMQSRNQAPAMPMAPVVAQAPQMPAVPQQFGGATAPQQITPPTGMSNAQYTAQVEQRLANAAQVLGSEGWQPVGTPFSGQLNTGQTQNVPAQLNAGVQYTIVGVCDQDCGDLDLRLSDASGAVLVQDAATDNQPVLQVSPGASGNYTLDVHMYACSVQPCFFSVALFGRVASN